MKSLLLTSWCDRLFHKTFNTNLRHEHWFAHCNWFCPIEHEIRHKFGKPFEIWNRSLFEQFCPSWFILVFKILSKFEHAPYQFRSKNLIVVVKSYSFEIKGILSLTQWQKFWDICEVRYYRSLNMWKVLNINNNQINNAHIF